MKHPAECRNDPEFRGLEEEILEAAERLETLMQRLRDSFPLEGMRLWTINTIKGRLCLVASVVSIPESENE